MRLLLLGAIGVLSACTQQPQRALPRPAPVPAPSCDRSFRVVNASSERVERLFFSPSRTGEWGADQLGQSVLPPGRSVDYQAVNTGRYDFRVVWATGREAQLRGVDICRTSRITIRNGGLRAG